MSIKRNKLNLLLQHMQEYKSVLELANELELDPRKLYGIMSYAFKTNKVKRKKHGKSYVYKSVVKVESEDDIVDDFRSCVYRADKELTAKLRTTQEFYRLLGGVPSAWC